MGDDAIKKLARVQAVEGASREEALSRALDNERTAAHQAARAQAAKLQAQSRLAADKDALLKTELLSAEELLRRADDFVRSRTHLEHNEALEAQKRAELAQAEAATRSKRLAWAESKSQQKALARKLRATEKRERDQRENREED